MRKTEFYNCILELARADRLEDIRDLPEARSHHLVCELSDSIRREGWEWFSALSQPDRANFTKAIAIYEDNVGGIGSATILQSILPEINDPEHQTLDWVLNNTHAYEYFAQGTRSAEELNHRKQQASERRSANLRAEEAREIEAKARKAAKATENLHSAVRRGDIKAVRALLAKGADSSVVPPGGKSLRDIAIAIDRLDIADLLSAHDESSESP